MMEFATAQLLTKATGIQFKNSVIEYHEYQFTVKCRHYILKCYFNRQFIKSKLSILDASTRTTARTIHIVTAAERASIYKQHHTREKSVFVTVGKWEDIAQEVI